MYEGLTDDQVNVEYDRMLEEFLGPDAVLDQLPMRGMLPDIFGGVVVIPDPGDLEPSRFTPRTPEEEELLPKFAVRAAQAVIARSVHPHEG